MELTTFQQVQELRERLRQASDAYYLNSVSIMTDAEYDMLFRALVQIEAAHPEWKTDDSPTMRVGSDLDSGSDEKVKHPAPILSLANAFNEDDVRQWQTRNATLVRPPSMSMVLGGSESLGYVVMPKFDGLTMTATYHKGVLVRAATRGDGEFGDDVTANARTIKTLPLRLRECSWVKMPSTLTVRGEVIIHKDDFAAYNATADQIAANPRNLASGSLKQKRSAEVAKRPLRIYVYDIVEINGLPASNHFSSVVSMLAALQDWGFVVAPVSRFDTLSEVLVNIESWKKNRETLPYEIDGIVVKTSNLAYFERLGYVGKDPRGAIAFKFPSQEVKTKLTGVRVTVGRSGVIQPTAILEPVQVGGVTVSNASLHNYEQIEAMDIRIGDTVLLKRSGDVIPYIVGSVKTERKGGEKRITVPTNCPHCDSLIEKSGARYFCTNVRCPERAARLIEYWAQRDNLNIDGLGGMTVRLLTDAGLVKTVADLYTLKADDLYALQGMGNKRADTLLALIEASKVAPWAVVLAALGIEGVGHTTCRELYNALDSVWDLKDKSVQALMNIGVNGIGVRTAETIHAWFSNPDNIAVLEALEKAGFNMKTEKPDVQGTLNLAGKKFVITGTHSVPRNELEDFVRANGGAISSSVSKKTDYLVAGDAAGSKLDKAVQLGVTVINEKQLRELAATISTPFDEE